jgi:hypothetical protein
MDRIQAFFNRLGRRRVNHHVEGGPAGDPAESTAYDQTHRPRREAVAVRDRTGEDSQQPWEKPIPTVEAGPGQAVPWVRPDAAQPQATPREEIDARRAA